MIVRIGGRKDGRCVGRERINAHGNILGIGIAIAVQIHVSRADSQGYVYAVQQPVSVGIRI